MKKILAALILVFLSSAAFAAPSSSALVTGKPEVSPYTQAIPGGLEVTYNGLWKHGNILEAYYTVTSSRGGRVSAEAANSKLIDANDIQISSPTQRREGNGYRGWRQYLHYGDNETFKAEVEEEDYKNALTEVKAGAYFNDEMKDFEEFQVNQPYKVAIRYWVPGEYVLTPTYKLITVIINGLPVEFKDATVGP